MESCVFCQIVKGLIPCYKIYEDDNFLAFLDIKPLNPGHTLLIPKKHFASVNDYEPFAQYWQIARKLAKIIQQSLNPITVSYVVYGLGVSHAHIHLIPKFPHDGHPKGPNPTVTKRISPSKMSQIAQKINSLI